MVAEVILKELNKRLADRNKEIEEKTRIYDDRLKELQLLEDSINKQVDQTKQLETKLDTLLEKEKQLFSKNYIIELEDKTYDLIGKEDITFIENKADLKKEVIDVLMV
jgi:chromosome segregation ATPase